LKIERDFAVKPGQSKSPDILLIFAPFNPGQDISGGQGEGYFDLPVYQIDILLADPHGAIFEYVIRL
jgi:hypothetical protein